jgi:hypothetical protein
MNLSQIMAALKAISTKQTAENVLQAAEQKLELLRRKLSRMESEEKELDNLVRFLRNL